MPRQKGVKVYNVAFGLIRWRKKVDVVFGRKRVLCAGKKNEIYSIKTVDNIGQQVALTRIDCYRVAVIAEQNFLTVRLSSLNPRAITESVRGIHI